MKNLIVGLSLAALSGSALAAFKSGNELKTGLTDWTTRPTQDWVTASIAAGYVMGTADALNGAIWCGRPQILASQVTAVVLKYLNENPENLDKDADSLIAVALRVAFPCPKK